MPFYYHTHHRRLRPQVLQHRKRDSEEPAELRVRWKTFAAWAAVDKVAVGKPVGHRP